MTPQLTSHLHHADRRAIIAYLSAHPTVEGWEKIAPIVVAPAGFRVVDAVRASNGGKWPVVQASGDYEIPDHLMIARGLRMARKLMRPAPGGFFPTGGSPTAGGRPQVETESGLQPVAISG